METVLREMVQREGFEAVFNQLKEIVTQEYERANRDYQFFLKITGEDKKGVQKDSKEASNTIEAPGKAVQENSEAVQENSEAVPKDSKTVEIAPTVTRKILRKKTNA